MIRPNRVGWALVIFFLIGGAIFTVVLPGIGIGQIWMAVAIFLAALYFLLGRFANRAEKSMGGGGTTGPITINQERVTDPAVQKSLMEALGEHGIMPKDGSTLDLRDMPAARTAVLAALEKHGIDVAHSTAAADPTTPVSESGAPVDRMAKLSELRDANLITEQEFEDHRKRILDGI